MKIFSIILITYFLSSCAILSSKDTSKRIPANIESDLNCHKAILSFTDTFAYNFKNKESYTYYQQFLEKHPEIDQEEFFRLSQDAAHGNIVDMRSIQEAQSMFHAVRNELIPGPLRRDLAEVDFIDGLGRPWDIKTPVSPGHNDEWNFRPQQIFNSLRNQIDMEFNGQKVRILLDFRNIKRREKKIILKWIDSNFSEEEKSRIIHIK